MEKSRQWIWIVLLGSAWGMNELLGGTTAFESLGSFRSLWLALFAVFILTAGRAIFNRAGTSLVLCAVAVAFKAVNTEPFFCHLLGIALLGIGFECMATLLLRGGSGRLMRAAWAGLGGVYLGRLAFALTLTYLLESEYWAAPESTKLFEHLVVTGIPAALGAALTAPLGFWLGSRIRDLSGQRPSLAFYGAAAASILLWVWGPFQAS